MGENREDIEKRFEQAYDEREEEEHRPGKIKIKKKVGMWVLIIGFIVFAIIQYGIKHITPVDIKNSIQGNPTEEIKP